MMRRIINHVLSISTILSVSTTTFAQNCGPNNTVAVTPTVNFRSQGTDNTRKIVGTEGHTHLYGMDCTWGMGALFIEFTQSFRPQKISQCLFGSDLVVNSINGSSSSNSTSSTISTNCNTGCNTRCTTDCDDGNCILIQGSTAAGTRNAKAWLADYFYLPTNYSGSICFDPRIRNVNIPFDLYIGLDDWLCNSYFRAYGTLTHTRWELNPCERPNAFQASSGGYPEGYFTSGAIAGGDLTQKALDFFTGCDVIKPVNGVKFDKLRKSKFYTGSKSATGYANLWLELGWDFINHCDYHLGVGFVAGAPTGGKRHAEFLFDPIVGNGNHWAIGGVITGHYTFWRSCDEEKYIGFHFDANITHLLTAREERTFDLCGKPNSRYMLAMKLGTDIQDNLATLNPGETPAVNVEEGQVTRAKNQFACQYTPLANLTTFDTKVSMGVQGDIAAKFNFTSCNWSWDIGYNFWGRSCEKIKIDNCDCEGSSLETECWALKGNAREYAFSPQSGACGLNPNTPVALNATQSGADIHNGTNTAALASSQNLGVDSQCPAYASSNLNYAALLRSRGLTFNTADTVSTSKDPICISVRDLDLVGTRGISNKIFTHINYTWDCECWIPFVGIGGFAEFGKNERGSCDTNGNSSSCSTSSSSCATSSSTCSTSKAACENNCRSCVDCSLSQWAIWIRGGVSWN